MLLESDYKKTQVFKYILWKGSNERGFKIVKYNINISYENNLNSVELFKSIGNLDSVELIILYTKLIKIHSFKRMSYRISLKSTLDI